MEVVLWRFAIARPAYTIEWTQDERLAAPPLDARSGSYAVDYRCEREYAQGGVSVFECNPRIGRTDPPSGYPSAAVVAANAKDWAVRGTARSAARSVLPAHRTEPRPGRRARARLARPATTARRAVRVKREKRLAHPRIGEEERRELLGKHVARTDRVPHVARHLVEAGRRRRNAPEMAVGQVLDLVVVVEDDAAVARDAEVLEQQVAGEDVDRGELARSRRRSRASRARAARRRRARGRG